MRSEPVSVNSILRWLVDGGRAVGFALLPPRCLLCGGQGAVGRDLCAACASELPRNPLACPRCAVPLAAPAPRCGECLRHEPPFQLAYAPFLYASPLDQLLMRLKFGGSLAAGRLLAELWCEAWRSLPPVLPQALVPVPLHAARLRERGYNQALELARPLARAFGLPLRAELLQRVRPTPAQAGLGAHARRRNLRGAFRATPKGGLPAHVAVVDDVMTTGATVAQCARVLRRAGVARVDVWALARAPRPTVGA